MGFAYIALVVLGVTTVALMAKLAARKGVPALDLSLVLFIVSTAFGALCAGLKAHGFPPALYTLPVAVIAAVAGGGGGLAVLAFNHAIRTGHFGFSNAIYRSSFLIPVVVGVLFFKAPLTAATSVGIVLVVAGVFLMSWSADSFRKGRATELKWFLTIMTAFLLSGLPRLGQLLTSTYKQNYFVYLFLSYAAGTLALVGPALAARRSLDRRSIPYGTVAALASYLAVFCTLRALETVSAPVLFPTTLCGPIILGLLLSLQVFRETIRPAGWAGILSGLAGIALLTIRR